MANIKKTIFLVTLLTVSLLMVSPTAHAGTSNSVEGAERLAQLNQATGASSGNSSTFENRLNAILSTNSSIERSYVSNQEETAREKAAQDLREDEKNESNTLYPDRYNPKKNKDNSQIADFNAAKESKYDGTEKAYQSAKENIQKEFDERIKKESQVLAEKRAALAAGKTEGSSSSDPALANNPFYFGDEKIPAQKKFESRRAVIVSRLVEHGLSESDADSAVGQSTGEEDLVVHLMKDYGFSYGDASEAAS